MAFAILSKLTALAALVNELDIQVYAAASYDISLLPRELVDNIIDHLHDDSNTLKACSLVCRDWLPSSHWHLFCEVRMKAEDLTDESDLVEFLRAGTTFAKSIRNLVFLAQPAGSPGPDIPTISPALALSILDCMPMVHSVVLRTAIAAPQNSTAPRSQWKRPSLRRLCFEFPFDTSTAWEVSQTCSFFANVHIGHLLMLGEDQATVPVTPVNTPLIQPHLGADLDNLAGWAVKSLTVANGRTAPAYIYIQLLQRILDVTKLIAFFTTDAPSTAPAVVAYRDLCPAFLRECSSLEVLHLHLYPLSYQGHLAAFKQGKTLTSQYVSSTFPIPWLSQMPKLHLRKLILTFSGQGLLGNFGAWKREADFAAIDNTLRRFPGLRAVVINLRPATGEGTTPLRLEDRRFMEKHLPRLYAAGKLSFV